MLMEKSLNINKNLSSKEERIKRKEIQKVLEQYEVLNADDVARKLVEVGIYDNIESYLPVLKKENNESIMAMVFNIGQLKVNLDNISIASEKTKKIVFALKNYVYRQHDDEAVLTNVKESVDTILTLYHNQMKYGLEVITNFQDVPSVYCFPDEIGQVWTNVLHNALQAMNYTGKLELEIKQNGDFVDVSFIDSGPGIPDDVLPNIFKPFYTTKRQGEGTGLGLDICNKIVEKHNGTITVQTEPGRTCFTISLPIAK